MAKSAVRSRPNAAKGRAASKGAGEDVAALKREIAALQSKLGERGPDPDQEIQEYPKAKFRTHPVTVRWPNGYETRRVETAEDEARLEKGWVDSPAEL